MWQFCKILSTFIANIQSHELLIQIFQCVIDQSLLFFSLSCKSQSASFLMLFSSHHHAQKNLKLPEQILLILIYTVFSKWMPFYRPSIALQRNKETALQAIFLQNLATNQTWVDVFVSGLQFLGIWFSSGRSVHDGIWESCVWKLNMQCAISVLFWYVVFLEFFPYDPDYMVHYWNDYNL